MSYNKMIDLYSVLYDTIISKAMSIDRIGLLYVSKLLNWVIQDWYHMNEF